MWGDDPGRNRGAGVTRMNPDRCSPEPPFLSGGYYRWAVLSDIHGGVLQGAWCLSDRPGAGLPPFFSDRLRKMNLVCVIMMKTNETITSPIEMFRASGYKWGRDTALYVTRVTSKLQSYEALVGHLMETQYPLYAKHDNRGRYNETRIAESPDPDRAREAYYIGIRDGIADAWTQVRAQQAPRCGKGVRADCLQASRVLPMFCRYSHEWGGAWRCLLPQEGYDRDMMKTADAGGRT